MIDILDKYPDLRGKPDEMAMLCALLRQRGLHQDALALGIAAVAAAPTSVAVREAVTNTLSTGVATFHIPMLLDAARNRAYVRAIEQAVRPGMTVLEIGTGAGLLAMTAARAGAQVVSCEEHPMIAATATEIVARNGLSDRIRIVPKRSTAIEIPTDLHEPADLVIHEIFGPSLFDEGVTAALGDARNRLLKPGAPSIPPRASVRFMLVREGNPRPPEELCDVEGFDLSLFRLLARAKLAAGAFRHLALQPASLAHGGLAMDYDAAPPFGPGAETITVAAFGGRIHGVMQWIAIDCGDDGLIENDPFADAEPSWSARYLPLVEPYDSEPGERFDVCLRHRGTALLFDVTRHGAQ